jgi:hypothetical protein
MLQNTDSTSHHPRKCPEAWLNVNELSFLAYKQRSLSEFSKLATILKTWRSREHRPLAPEG